MKRPNKKDYSYIGDIFESWTYCRDMVKYADHLEDEKIALINGFNDLIRYDHDGHGDIYADSDGYYLEHEKAEQMFSSIKPDKPTYKPGDTVIITGNMIDDCQYHGLDIGRHYAVLDVYNDFEVIVNNLNARVIVFNKDIKHED